MIKLILSAIILFNSQLLMASSPDVYECRSPDEIFKGIVITIKFNANDSITASSYDEVSKETFFEDLPCDLLMSASVQKTSILCQDSSEGTSENFIIDRVERTLEFKQFAETFKLDCTSTTTHSFTAYDHDSLVVHLTDK